MKNYKALEIDNNRLLFIDDLTHDNMTNINKFIMQFLHSSITNVGYWQIASCLIAINNMLTKSFINSRLIPSQSSEWIKMSCPYTFHFIKDNIVLPFNKEYKPLGIHYDGYYPTFTEFEFQSIPIALINLNSCPKILNNNQYYLYHDGNSPWHDKECLIGYQLNLFKLLNFNIIEVH